VVSDRPPPGFADQPGVGGKHSDGGRKQVRSQTLSYPVALAQL
jgi:hypothetical protein